jgi:hypothetical protein
VGEQDGTRDSRKREGIPVQSRRALRFGVNTCDRKPFWECAIENTGGQYVEIYLEVERLNKRDQTALLYIH